MSFSFHIRNVRHVSAVLLVLLLACILATPAPAGAARPERCKASGAETLIVTRDARIYKTTIKKRYQDETVVYHCARRTGKRFELSRLIRDQFYLYGSEATFFRRIGKRFAYVVNRIDTYASKYGYDQRGPTLRIINARTGRKVRAFELVGNSWVTGFEARPGAMAWIERNGKYLPSSWSVHVYSNRQHKELDSGQSVDPESLSTDGTSIFWVDGGERESAPFG